MLKIFLLILNIMLFFIPHTAAFAEQSEKKWRIIALGSPAVEILTALGMEESIIARASWDTWPPFIKKLPHIGNPNNPNLELILRLKPDVILLDRHFGILEEKLKKFSIPFLTIDAYNTQDIIPAVKKIAEYFGREQKARNLIQDLLVLKNITKERIDSIPQHCRKRGIIISGTMVMFSFSQKSGAYVLENSGAVNAAAGFSQPYPIISREWMIKEKPDFIVMITNLEGKSAQQGKKIYQNTIKELQKLKILQSDQNSETMCILFDLPLTFGFRSFIGHIYLAKAIYPKYFLDINPDRLHKEFLQKYFHTENTGEYIYP